eukprot:TRINITY_DN24850_c0_g1_i1.p1 TRINITY_DN24850_c0_g1~~TRINITY_DN24850_c0_g1_i1.p1  ORF type:complete len:473 (-),score=95.80 TRINITY_DN24850_c0_g1_i1:107-1525(-)
MASATKSVSFDAEALKGKQQEPDPNLKEWRLKAFVIIICFVVIGEGYDIGVLNGALVQLSGDLGLSTLQGSLLVTATPVAVLVACPFGGYFADCCGRKRVLAGVCFVLAVGAVIMALAEDYVVLVSGRVLIGGAIGTGIIVVSMLLAEIAPNELRGRAVSMEEVSLNIGILGGYFVSWLLRGIKHDWRYMLGLGAVLPCCLLLIVLFGGCIPESPRWLIQHGRTEEARTLMTRFLTHDQMTAMETSWAEQQKGFGTFQDVVQTKDRAEQKMLLAALVVACGQMISGYLYVAYYSSHIMTELMSKEAAFFGTVMMGLVKLAVLILALMVIDTVGRRNLLLAGSAVSFLGCAWVAAAFHYEAHSFMIVGGFLLYMTGFSIGFGPVTFVYCTEIFPTRIRGKAFGLVMSSSRILAALTTLLLPLLSEATTVSTTFGLLGAINIAVAGLVFAYVPETMCQDPEKMHTLLGARPAVA